MTNNMYVTLDTNSDSEHILFNEMSNFIDIQSGYSDFVANAAFFNGAEMLAANESFDSGPKCLIQSRREIGLNVFYQVCLVHPRGSAFQVNIPWQAQEACPHCQGQGQVYGWNSDNSAYEGLPCEECGGEGFYGYDSEITLFIDDSVSDQPLIRKRKAGRFNPRQGQRGDLIITITWVDELPAAGETVN